MKIKHCGFDIVEKSGKFGVAVIGMGRCDHWRIFDSLDSAKKEAEKLANVRAKQEKSESEQELREQEEIAANAEKEKLYSYLDKKLPMQKQRAIDHLERSVCYNGIFTDNAGMIHTCISEGKKPLILLLKNKNTCVMQSNDGVFVEITKTQYEFAQSLVSVD